MNQDMIISIDAGCGTNKKAQIGLDIVKTPSVDIICDLEHIPVKKDSVDSIISEHVIEHVEKPYDVLREFHRILKKGGILNIATPHAFTTGAYSIDHKNYFVLRSLDYVLNPFLVEHYSGLQFKLKSRTLRLHGRLSKHLNPVVRTNPMFFERLLKFMPFEPDIQWIMEK